MRTFFCLCRCQEVPPLSLAVASAPLWLGAMSRACRPRAPASPPSLLAPRTTGTWDRFAGSSESRRLPGTRPRRAREGRDESVRHGAESQWIVAARPLCHLQYPVTVFKSPAKDSNRRGLNCASGRPPPTSPPMGAATTRALGSRKAPNGVGKQAGGGGADVPPQPNSPPDNVFRRSARRGEAFEPKRRGNAPPPTNGINDEAFGYLKRVIVTPAAYPLWLNFFTLTFRALGRNHIASEVGCSTRRKAPKGAVPIRPPPASLTTPPRRWSSSSSPPTADGFDWDPVPSPRANPFPGYGSILPTSLAYIVPSTRGCSPWRPDAVMSNATRRGRTRVLRFSGPPGDRHHADAAVLFPAAGPYLRLSRFQVGRLLNRKDNSSRGPPPTPPTPLTLPPTATPRFRNFNPIPFRGSSVMHAILRASPALLGSTNPCASAAHMEPFPSSPSKFSFEYLLLPPRSAPTAAPPRLKAEVFMAAASPPYSSRPGCCPRRVGVWVSALAPSIFGLVDSAGRGRYADASNHWLYPIELATPGLQLSRGKLRGNQLLDGSISLSPLYPSRRTICIARSLRASTRVSSGFPPPGIVHHLSVPAETTYPLAGSSAWLVARDQRRSVDAEVEGRTGSRRPAIMTEARIAAPIRFPPDNFKHSLTLFSKSFSSFPQAVLVRYRSLAAI
ncbi:hypothetical protein H6P81_021713 [Aristolochia fimbriata]|uniref:Uncharacterized protein n=1 Tax=Aristolochia fimbriata TaxID=158543 RepID=A0AAV7DS18_ARIFI|nr:hypothetical protein H6P81_021713 [Aristolochia fimbriata]